jgi:5-methylcytosine-specific restriction endonuclease McrA
MSAIGLRTLVLNANYMPVSIFPLHTIPAEDAVTRIINGTCRPVFEYDRNIKTPTIKMNWPSVVARVDTDGIRETLKLTDQALYYRDHGVCMYCERELRLHEVTCDHVVPKSRGGKFSWDNIVTACADCNLKKGDAAPVGMWRPKVMPFKPSYYQLLNVRRKFPIEIDDRNWMQFLGDWEADVILRNKVA